MPDFISFAPLVSPWLIAALGIAAVPVLVLYLFHHAHGGLLRAALFAVLLLALANPLLREEDREDLNDVAVVIVDQSQSQTLENRTARVEQARKRLEQALGRVARLDVRWASFQQGQGAQPGTRLFSTLSKALIDVPPDRLAGVIMLSDGQVHDVPKALSALGFDAPVHALMTGRTDEGDRRIVIERAPRYGIVGQRRFITLRVIDDLATPEAASADESTKAKAQVTVSIDGNAPETYQAPVGERVNIPFSIEHGGANVIEMVAGDGPKELTGINNRALVTTQGVRERLRVLLVSGAPHAGERTWRNLLKADAAVDLVHFTILRPPEKQDGTPIRELSLIAFPTRELFSVKLNEFDLIIFDRYQRRGVLPLLYLSNVSDYVENGGAVLDAGGPAFASPLSLYRTPLASVLPAQPTGGVTEEPYRPKLTDKGRRHPVTRDLKGSGAAGKTPEWGRWFRLIDAEALRGDVVMSGPEDKPLVVLSRQGKGRVAQLLSDHSWLWSRGYDGGGPQAELLRRLAHWLMKEPDLEEEALLGRHDGNEIIIERRTMADSVNPVVVTPPQGDEQKIELTEASPGLWRGRIGHSGIGLYRLDDGKLKGVVAVGAADPKEMQEVIATDRHLKPILAASGGRAYWLAQGPGDGVSLPRIEMVAAGRQASGESWLGLKRNNAYSVRAIEERSLTSGLLALALLLGLLALTWWREGR